MFLWMGWSKRTERRWSLLIATVRRGRCAVVATDRVVEKGLEPAAPLEPTSDSAAGGLIARRGWQSTLPTPPPSRTRSRGLG
jgi:hypothetical protein